MIDKRTRNRLLLASALALLLAPLALHFAVSRLAALTPPAVEIDLPKQPKRAAGLERLGNSYRRQRGQIHQVGLAGKPENIGFAHSRLFYEEMAHIEGVMFERLEEQIPSRFARTLLFDLAQWRYRSVDSGMSHERVREIAAGALGFQPDPFEHIFPTFQRFVYLNALYDISLSFEHSPLLGCTSFVVSKDATLEQAPYLARAFDFEVDDVFDQQKAVFLVKELGRIPFASVAWPGLVGVVSGMNIEGLAVVVHGARAGPAETAGEPVVHALRRVLGTARTTREAIARLRERQPLVSHIVVMNDRHGSGAAIERIPGREPYVRQLADRAAITNHFESEAATDPKNQRVLEATSTLPRRRRADELLAKAPGKLDERRLLKLLRDRSGVGDRQLELGDRRSIDALIATHGVIMNTEARVLWVSEGPHLLGRFIEFDLIKLLNAEYDPAQDTELVTLPADDLLGSERYRNFERSSDKNH